MFFEKCEFVHFESERIHSVLVLKNEELFWINIFTLTYDDSIHYVFWTYSL